MVARARDDFAGRPIRDFVPLLVERRIRSQLAASWNRVRVTRRGG